MITLEKNGVYLKNGQIVESGLIAQVVRAHA